MKKKFFLKKYLFLWLEPGAQTRQLSIENSSTFESYLQNLQNPKQQSDHSQLTCFLDQAIDQIKNRLVLVGLFY